MAKKRQTKIDKFNLGPRVVELAFRERETDTAIARIITEESGVNISQPTVTRWLEEKRRSTADDVRALLVEHTHNELPKDLDSMEEMQARLMAWARETAEETHKRIEKEIGDEEVLAFAGKISGMLATKPGEEVVAAVRDFMARVANVTAGIYKNRRARTEYMGETRKIIASKLQYAGAMEATEAGNIIIKTHSEDPSGGPGAPGDSKDKPVRMTLVKGGPGHA